MENNEEKPSGSSESSDSLEYDVSEDEKDLAVFNWIFGRFEPILSAEMPLEDVDDFEDPREHCTFRRRGYTTKPFLAFGTLVNVWSRVRENDGSKNDGGYQFQLYLQWRPFSCPRGARMVYYYGGHMFVLVNRQNLKPLLFGREITDEEIEFLIKRDDEKRRQLKEKEEEEERQAKKRKLSDVQFIREVRKVPDNDVVISTPSDNYEPNLREVPESSAASEEREKRYRESQYGGQSSSLAEAVNTRHEVDKESGLVNIDNNSSYPMRSKRKRLDDEDLPKHPESTSKAPPHPDDAAPSFFDKFL